MMDIDENTPPSSLGRVSKILRIVLFGGTILAALFMAILVFVTILLLIHVSGTDVLTQVWPDDSPSPGLMLHAMIPLFLGTGVTLYILKQLGRINTTLIKGDPFVPENSSRLRRIWIALVGFEVVRMPLAFLAASLIAPEATGHGEYTVEIRLFVWFVILIIVVLAEVFREGARLRHEQQLTI